MSDCRTAPAPASTWWLAAILAIAVATGVDAQATRANRQEPARPEPRGDEVDTTRHIRALTPLAHQLVRDGMAGSAGFRSLVTDLSATDVIVQVRTDRRDDREGRCHANLRFIGAGPGARYVQVWVDAWWQSRLTQVALLAHELRHAVEIGQSPDARDRSSVEALFRRIGRPSVGGRFETRAATTIQAVVSSELAGGRAR